MFSRIKAAAGQVADVVTDGFARVAKYFTPESLIDPLTRGFREAGIITVDLLKNDNLVRLAAGIALDLMPGSLLIKVIVGEERFVQFVFGIRNLLLAAGTLDFSSVLTMDTIKKVLVDIGLVSAEDKKD